MRILKLIRNFGKINKDYYKYAFIEIFLIIVGILIALEVNNTNENRKIKAEEEKVLLSLHNEISSSLVNLDFVLSKKRQIINAGTEILKHTGPKGEWKSEQKFDSLIYYVFFSGWRHVPQEGVLNEILNAGKLSIISDSNLKVQISSLPKTFSQILEEDRVLRTGIWQYFNPFLNKVSSVIISMQSSYLKFNIEMLEKLKIKYKKIQDMVEKKYPKIDYLTLKENIDRGVWN